MKNYIVDERSFVSGVNTSDIVDGTSTQIIAAQGTDVKTYVTSIVLTNSSATSSVVKVLDGSTTKARIFCKGEGGASVTLGTPLRGSANTAWNVQCETVGAAVQANLQGFRRVEG